MICRIMSIEEFILRWYDTHVFGQVNVSEVKDIFKHKIPWKTMATRVVNADNEDDSNSFRNSKDPGNSCKRKLKIKIRFALET